MVVNYVNDAKAADEVVQAIRSQGKGGAIAVKANAATMEGSQFLLDEAIRTFGHLDILVLNAGIMGSRPLAEVDESFYDSHFDTNVKAPLFMAKAAAPLLSSRMYSIGALYTVIANDRLQAGGRVIFFSSSLTSASSTSRRMRVCVPV